MSVIAVPLQMQQGKRVVRRQLSGVILAAKVF